MRYRYLLALSLAVTALPALAHDPLPALDWCRSGRTVPVGEFDFDGRTLRSYQKCTGSGGNPAGSICALLPIPTGDDGVICSPAQCGEFDDDYHVAKMAAFRYCQSLRNLGPKLRSGSAADTDDQVVPLFAPDQYTFNSSTHHTDYDLDEGIKGMCMLCLRAESDDPTE